jgi:hypothetical protein
MATHCILQTDLVGLTIGVVSLAFQVFAGYVKGALKTVPSEDGLP